MESNCCGTCKYHRYDDESSLWICRNKNSGNYEKPTHYEVGCEKHKDKRWAPKRNY